MQELRFDQKHHSDDGGTPLLYLNTKCSRTPVVCYACFAPVRDVPTACFIGSRIAAIQFSRMLPLTVVDCMNLSWACRVVTDDAHMHTRTASALSPLWAYEGPNLI